MDSIMQKDRKVCFLCGEGPRWAEGGMWDRLEEHHIFAGNPGRRLSEKYGLKVCLHGLECHREGKGSAHKNAETRRMLQEMAQKSFEQVHGTREEFMKIFGRNYL